MTLLGRMLSISKEVGAPALWIGALGVSCGAAAAEQQFAGSKPPPLQAQVGVTALSGRILGPDGSGLAGIEVGDNSVLARTDSLGRFLLAYVPPGHSVLRINGRRGAGVDYGVYEISVTAKPGVTTPLTFSSWLMPIDHTHDIEITSPTTSEVVLTTPQIPDLEIHIPAGVVVRDSEGQIVTHLGITAVPSNRTPYPLPGNFRMSTFFTIQPGAACFYTPTGGLAAVRMITPNWGHELPKARAGFWRYEPDRSGWTPYGAGSVSSDGRQIIPDPGVFMTNFGSAECDPMTRSHTESFKLLQTSKVHS